MSVEGNTGPSKIGASLTESVPGSLDAAGPLLESVPLDTARPEHEEILARARGFSDQGGG